MRLTHVEFTVAEGTLTDAFAADLDRLLHDVFGWEGRTSVAHHPTRGQTPERSYAMSDGVGLVLREGPEGMASGSEDHLGLLVEPEHLDALAARCRELAALDGRVELRYVDDGRPSRVDAGAVVFATFFVRYLMPIWFQFESYQQKPPGDMSGEPSEEAIVIVRDLSPAAIAAMPRHDLVTVTEEPPSPMLPFEFHACTAGIASTVGTGPWELHSAGDELLHVLAGEMHLTVREPDGDATRSLRAGHVVVVPRGCWHQSTSASGVTLLYLTPTEGNRHSFAPPPPTPQRANRRGMSETS